MKRRIDIDLATLRKAYFALIDKPDVSEEAVHQFLACHPAFLPLWFPYKNTIFSKLTLGSQHVLDFAFPRLDSPGVTWHFIEIERPQYSLFTKSGDPTRELTHGLRQLQDWQGWFNKNRDYIIRYFPFGRLMKEQSLWQSQSALVIGRRATLTDENRELLQNICPLRTEIMTFDRLAERLSRPACDIEKPLRSARYVKNGIETISEMTMQISYSMTVDEDDA